MFDTTSDHTRAAAAERAARVRDGVAAGRAGRTTPRRPLIRFWRRAA